MWYYILDKQDYAMNQINWNSHKFIDTILLNLIKA